MELIDIEEKLKQISGVTLKPLSETKRIWEILQTEEIYSNDLMWLVLLETAMDAHNISYSPSGIDEVKFMLNLPRKVNSRYFTDLLGVIGKNHF